MSSPLGHCGNPSCFICQFLLSHKIVPTGSWPPPPPSALQRESPEKVELRGVFAPNVWLPSTFYPEMGWGERPFLNANWRCWGTYRRFYLSSRRIELLHGYFKSVKITLKFLNNFLNDQNPLPLWQIHSSVL